jgi:hypothetical protein
VPYALLLAAMIVAAVGVMIAPETVLRTRPLPAYRPQRISVPREGRGLFLSALLGIVLVTTLHRTSPALAGGTVFVVFAVGTATAVATVTWPLRCLLLSAVSLMIAGLVTAVTAAWLPAPSLALFLLGGAVVGAGGAAGFKGTLGVVVAVSPPGTLAEALAAYFLYLSVPVALLIFSAAVAAALLAATPVLLRLRAPERAAR